MYRGCDLHKKGFTIVELMVVMSIMAVMSILGISALINLNNDEIADRAAQALVSQIREVQNKAFSVESVDENGTSFPLMWGVYLDASTESSTQDTVKIRYITCFDAEMNACKNEDILDVSADIDEGEKTLSGDNIVFQEAGFSKLLIQEVDSSGNAIGDYLTGLRLFYSTPFGGYEYVEGSGDIDKSRITMDEERPYSLHLDKTAPPKSFDITIQFRNSTKVIRIAENGDVFIRK
jgi:prepilin-type N-terminal cleavage/methylation domain-containing protein